LSFGLADQGMLKPDLGIDIREAGLRGVDANSGTLGDVIDP